MPEKTHARCLRCRCLCGRLLRMQAVARQIMAAAPTVVSLSRRAVELADRAGARDRAVKWVAREALIAAQVGKTTRARELVQEAHAMNPEQRPEESAVLALAAARETDHALEQAQQLNQLFPLNTLVQRYELPIIRAQIYLQQDNPSSAMEVLQQAAPYELTYDDPFALQPIHERGLAYLEARQAERAAAEFRKVLVHRGIVVISINGALAHLQLGRAQVMMGDKAAARKSYQDFLTLWKDADPDIPIYKQAKAEYAKLQ